MKFFKSFFIFLLSTCKVFSLYQGNPSSSALPALGFFFSEESCFGLKLGYQKNHQFKKQMKSSAGQSDLCLNSNQASIILNWIDRVDFISTIGAQELFFKEGDFKNEKTNALVWSVGGNSSLIFWDRTSLGVAMTYLFSYPSFQKKTAHYQEWQILLAVCQRVDFFSFYLGGAFNRTQIKRNLEVAFKNSHPIAMVIGGSFFTKKGFVANGELRFFGETALGFDFTLRF